MLLLFLLSSFQALAKGRYDDAIEELLDVGACTRRALNVRRALWYRLLQRSDLILSHGKALACKRLSRISRGISTWSCIPTLSSHHLAYLTCIRPRSRWRHCPWLAHTVSTDPEHRIRTQRFEFIGGLLRRSRTTYISSHGIERISRCHIEAYQEGIGLREHREPLIVRNVARYVRERSMVAIRWWLNHLNRIGVHPNVRVSQIFSDTIPPATMVCSVKARNVSVAASLPLHCCVAYRIAVAVLPEPVWPSNKHLTWRSMRHRESDASGGCGEEGSSTLPRSLD